MAERRARNLLLGSAAALVAMVAAALSVGYAGLKGAAIRTGGSILVGPQFSGDTILDGGRTLVAVDRSQAGDRSIHVSRAQVPGQYQVTITRQGWTLAAGGTSHPVRIAGFVLLGVEPGPTGPPQWTARARGVGKPISR
jgi:hypothetical protein